MTSALHVVANLQIGAVAYTSVCVRVSPAGTNRKPKTLSPSGPFKSPSVPPPISDLPGAKGAPLI